MKKLLMACVAAGLANAVFADPSVENMTVRQRWPWNEKVDIDFTLVADGACDLELEATWQNRIDPVVLTIGRQRWFKAQPGANHLVWDPAEAGYGGQPLANFTVRPRLLAPVADRTYLVLNLETGDYSFAATEPPASEGGWTNDLHRTKRMVFRRVPAGTYQLGYDDEQLGWLIANITSSQKDKATWRNAMGRREATVSSDYYIAIYQMTSGQYLWAAGSSGSGMQPYNSQSVASMRGTVTDGIDWPRTGHACKPNSGLDKMRNHLKLPEGWILDLPTEDQWEIAARAGTTTLTPNGGTVENTKEEVRDIVSSMSWSAKNTTVGLLAPNAWGLYDVLGMSYEMTLNVYDCTTVKSGSLVSSLDCYSFTTGFRGEGPYVDAVGVESALEANQFHLTCNVGWSPGVAPANTVGNRRAYRDDQNVIYRPCVHLNPLVK